LVSLSKHLKLSAGELEALLVHVLWAVEQSLQQQEVLEQKPASGKPAKAKSPPDPIESGSEDKHLSAAQVTQFAAGLKKGMKVRLHEKYKEMDKDFAKNPQDYPKGFDGLHTTQTAKVKAVKIKDGKVDVTFEDMDEGFGGSANLKSHPSADRLAWTYKAEVVND